MKSLDISSFMELSNTRQIWIWGAGNQGRGLCQALQNNGIDK